MTTINFRELLIGRPLATSQALHERLGKRKALAVFASDVLSSTAYATEEILFVLILAGTGALTLSIWQIGALINGIGALATLTVLGVIIATRFTHGAWIIIVLIPVIVGLFLMVHRHYLDTAAQLSLDEYGAPPRIRRHHVIVPVAGVHRGVLQALHYARTLSNDVTAVYVENDPAETEKLHQKWTKWGDGIRLVILPSEYRSIIEPLIAYLDRVDACLPDDVITVVMPQFLASRWWHTILHNQTALLIRMALLFRRGMVVTDVPYRLKD